MPRYRRHRLEADIQLILDDCDVRFTDAELLTNIKELYIDPNIEHMSDTELLKIIEDHVSRSVYS